MALLAWLADEPHACVERRIYEAHAISSFWQRRALYEVPEEAGVLRGRWQRARERYDALASAYPEHAIKMLRAQTKHPGDLVFGNPDFRPRALSESTFETLKRIATRIAPLSTAARTAAFAEPPQKRKANRK